MLGKDYMLAIILVNCDDNLWSDQSLETDPDLPPGWRKIHDSLGTYYWHVPTGTTQWQHPARSTSPGGCLEADEEETLQETDCQASVVKHTSKARPVPSPMASLTRRTSLTWQGDDFQQCGAEPSSKCFAVRSLGWVEIPEEDLAPGKSSIAVNNCIQQLSNSQGRGSADSWGEGQDLVMILKKDTMSLVDPLDHSLIHCQPILNIRVWGVGCNKGRDRDFAFVASDKDTCVLKCHVFRCNVPAKGIAKALHGMCSQIVAERAAAGSGPSPHSAALEPISAATWPLRTADVQDAVGRPPRRYEALYIGSRPVPRAMGMDVLNAAIEQLLAGPGRNSWTPAHVCVSDTAVRVRRAQVGPGRGRGGRGGVEAGPARRPQEEDEAHVWQCEVRYVTFLGVGRDAHTFALIADTGRRFQCAAFWCEPDAGTISEAVQAACMVSGAARGDGEADPDPEPPAATPPASPQVQYQKCLVAAAPGPKAKRAAAAGAKAGGGSGGAAGPGPRKRGVLSLLEAFRQRHALLHLP
ncbi:amyloid-beta A4 precursor protein-binding family B member 3 isoform X2 [Gallus gallus]|uniref:amyloid-beta A4 precursor protein-binding family B member 3 isoform X2 n=1 Tax=Gallus gallus TaxID=9031 RepID=UPI001AE10F73|nr:amyloid-beta A4 precursor protein-binding family B member 3 isoform X2 [Gallus gallus]XP_040538522.1 amyloid-beta A4 precursor protein-binding family B member 3 isoform X2 [Gallus gallus]